MFDKICRKCGTTLSSFYDTGMLGCPYCYEEFKNEITNTLVEIQNKTYHVGKTPKFSIEDKNLLSEYRNLFAEREKLVIDGKFTQMKEVARRIYVVEEELKKRGLI